MRRRSLVGFFATATAAALVPRSARADDVILKIDLPRSTTAVGKGVFCDVVIEREGGSVKDLGEPEFPELEGLDVNFQGQSFSQSVRIVNGIGTRKSTTTYSYLLLPNKAGDYALDVELEVEINGRKRTLSPATVPKLSVTGTAAATASPSRADASARPDKADGEVFAWPAASKGKVYVGEQFVYTYELWERTRSNVEHKTLPKLKDVYTRELETPRRVRSEYLDGYRYRVHTILRRAAFAQKSGTLELGGGTFTVRPSSGLGFFAPPKGSAPYSVSGPAAQIEVLPLPAKGRPKDFRAGNVGTFTIEAVVDRDALKQGDGLTLTVTIEGEGNMALVEPGAWPEFDGFASYDPKDESTETIEDSTVGGTRTFEILLVAQRGGAVEIPPVALSYFDPKTERYLTIETKALTIEVEGDGTLPAPALGNDGAAEEDSDATLAPTVDTALSRTPRRDPFMTAGRFWWGAAAIPAALGAWFGGLALWRRVGPDEGARAVSAQTKAQEQRLARAHKAKGSPEFFEPVGAFLQQLAQAWAGPEGAGRTRERIMGLLDGRVPTAQRAELQALLELCDAARFGGVTGADHAEILGRVEALAQEGDR